MCVLTSTTEWLVVETFHNLNTLREHLRLIMLWCVSCCNKLDVNNLSSSCFFVWGPTVVVRLSFVYAPEGSLCTFLKEDGVSNVRDVFMYHTDIWTYVLKHESQTNIPTKTLFEVQNFWTCSFKHDDTRVSRSTNSHFWYHRSSNPLFGFIGIKIMKNSGRWFFVQKKKNLLVWFDDPRIRWFACLQDWLLTTTVHIVSGHLYWDQGSDHGLLTLGERSHCRWIIWPVSVWQLRSSIVKHRKVEKSLLEHTV
jgi:hypothetical protein